MPFKNPEKLLISPELRPQEATDPGQVNKHFLTHNYANKLKISLIWETLNLSTCGYS